ncbi:MAG: nitroreductase [Alphaproteobacteria bacterium]|nr:nitroreductase [Alphaproteobacteria bacterium]
MEDDARLFDIIHTTRAMRRLKPDPVPDELIRKILEAARSAPSGGNAQQWGFIVVKDRPVKERIQPLYEQAWDEVAWPHYKARLDRMEPGPEKDTLVRQIDAVEHLTRHFHEVPVWIVACLEVGRDGGNPGSGASIYPAVQNMLLAARALGLGATLTTRHMAHGKEVDAVLGLPDGVRSFAIVPIGYPKGRFGPVRRRPLDELVHLDRWGAAYR